MIKGYLQGFPTGSGISVESNRGFRERMSLAAFAGFKRLDAVGGEDFNLSLNALVQRRIESLHGVLFLVPLRVAARKGVGFEIDV
jgi:hypothetical protein